MGFDARKKSGNVFAGSRLIVEGQGILTVKSNQMNSVIKKLPKDVSVSKGNPPSPTPNITPTSLVVFSHNFTLCCIDTPITLYSLSSSIIVGSYLYSDISLTTPYYDISLNLIPGAVLCNDPFINGVLTDITGLVTSITDAGSCN